MTGVTLAIASIFVRVLVVNSHWHWFAVPLGAPAIDSLWHIVGLSSMVSIATTNLHAKTGDESLTEKSMASLLTWLICWALGAFYAGMMR